MKKYVLGMDFGTLSARAIIVDALSGEELSESVFEYPHGVMDRELPDGTLLPPRCALEHPEDYLVAMKHVISEAIALAGLTADDISGVGLDFTGCTMLAVDENATPLCFDDKYKNNPCAYVQLWKSHHAEEQAQRITAIAKERGEKWLDIYGGAVISEWMLPKILYILENAPEIYDAAYRFTEAGDWLTHLLTGNETHATSFVGLKALWNAEDGYPTDEFFAAVHPKLAGIIGSKLSENILPVGDIAGYIDERGAALTGLKIGTPVAQAVIDAPAGMPGLGIIGEGELMAILGTSGCYIVNSKKSIPIKGIAGYVKESIYSGYYTYEAGQCCLGDGFDWFIKNFVPESYTADAESQGVNIHKYLREKAKKMKIGESRLIVLDWFNGNRSVLSDGDLSGMIVGLTLSTRPEHIYRAMIEGMAFGAKMIVDNFDENGLPIKSICASGGIARKDELLMQIFADVLGREIKVGGTTQACALGSTVYASVAAGIHSNMDDAIKAIAKPPVKTYYPIPENHKAYLALFEEYKVLHDYFGRGGNNVMKRI